MLGRSDRSGRCRDCPSTRTGTRSHVNDMCLSVCVLSERMEWLAFSIFHSGCCVSGPLSQVKQKLKRGGENGKELQAQGNDDLIVSRRLVLFSFGRERREKKRKERENHP